MRSPSILKSVDRSSGRITVVSKQNANIGLKMMHRDSFIEFVGNCCIVAGFVTCVFTAPTGGVLTLAADTPSVADFMLCLGLLFRIAIMIDAWWHGAAASQRVHGALAS